MEKEKKECCIPGRVFAWGFAALWIIVSGVVEIAKAYNSRKEKENFYRHMES